MKTYDRLPLRGEFRFELYRKGKLLWVERVPNIVVNEGRNYILGGALGAATQLTQFYIAPFSNNYTPLITDTAATIVASAGEQTGYDEATRELWVPVTAAQIISNAATPAEFTFNVVSPTVIYGLFMSSASAKSAVTGTLIGAAKFATSRTVEDNDIGRATYGINAN